jgi:hypothetical protein
MMARWLGLATRALELESVTWLRERRCTKVQEMQVTTDKWKNWIASVQYCDYMHDLLLFRVQGGEDEKQEGSEGRP